MEREGSGRCEEASAEAGRLTQMVVDALPVQVARLDEEGRVVAVNRAWKEFIHREFPEIVDAGLGQAYVEVIRGLIRSEEEAKGVEKGVREVLGGERGEFQKECELKVGVGQMWVVVHVRRVEVGEIRQVVVAHEDVTDFKRRQQVELERSGLERVIRVMEGVLEAIGQELCSPLAGLRAITQLLMKEEKELGGEARSVEAIQAEAVRIGQTVGNLLESARLSSGAIRRSWEEVELEELCENVVGLVEPVAESRGVRVLMEIEPEGLTMRGDPEALERLVLNLLSNAVEVSREGEVRLVVRGRGEEGGKRWVEIRVQDCGPGMSEEVIRELEAALPTGAGVMDSRGSCGPGLGLAICKGIVAVHGGQLRIRTKQGLGTTVTAAVRADLEGPMAVEMEGWGLVVRESP